MPKSPFAALGPRRAAEPASSAAQSDVQPGEEPKRKLSKRDDENYQKFTVYIPKSVHRRTKSIAADQGKELSLLVEELLIEYNRRHRPD